MKFRQIYPVLLATAAVALSSCDDSDSSTPQPAEQAKSAQAGPELAIEQNSEATAQEGQTPATDATEQPAVTEPATDTTEQPAVTEPATDTTEQPAVTEPAVDTTEQPTDSEPAVDEPGAQDEPTDAQVVEVVRTAIQAMPKLDVGETSITSAPQADGSLLLTATAKLTAKEDLTLTRELSAIADEIRKGINDTANKAMQPDSLYLLQIGAAATDITDAQRQAKPLPANLKTMADELKELTDIRVGVSRVPANGEAGTLTVTMKAVKDGDNWQISNVAPNNDQLQAIQSSLQPADATEADGEPKMIDANYEEDLRQKVIAFNEAARTYILSREETARAIYTEKQALVEETLRKAEAAAADKQENEKFCCRTFVNGKTYTGEWKRGSRFGTIAIFVRKAVRFDESVQFVGTLYDPKLPAASLDISGRCEFEPNEKGELIVNIEIYDGKYDPNKPTAEVFDSGDSALRLVLTKDSKMKGKMGCHSWGANSDKNFDVSLIPADQMQEQVDEEPIPGLQ